PDGTRHRTDGSSNGKAICTAGKIRSANMARYGGSRPAGQQGRRRRSVETARRRALASRRGPRIGAAGTRSATHRDSLRRYFKMMRPAARRKN
ncbi:hypothetical protein A4X13_0g9255, partial [Tilletia indica]